MGTLLRGLGVALVGAVLLTGTSSTLAASPSRASAPDSLEFVQVLIAAVNSLREEHALSPLSVDPTLQQLSQNYAVLMADSDCLSHDCDVRGQVGDRARSHGYDYLLIGEALAGGPPDVERVVQLWMMSEPHRRILLNDQVRQVGAGHFYRPDDDGAADYGHYWVLTVSLVP